MFDYPEIEKLNQIYVRYKVETKTDRSRLLGGSPYYPMVLFKLNGKTFQIYVDDEYDDLRLNYPLLNLCLVLRELEGYDYADDILVWCIERGLDPADPHVLGFYRELGRIYKQVEATLGKVDPFVSDWDFEMNAGAAQALRRSD